MKGDEVDSETAARKCPDLVFYSFVIILVVSCCLLPSPAYFNT